MPSIVGAAVSGDTNVTGQGGTVEQQSPNGILIRHLLLRRDSRKGRDDDVPIVDSLRLVPNICVEVLSIIAEPSREIPLPRSSAFATIYAMKPPRVMCEARGAHRVPFPQCPPSVGRAFRSS